MTISICLKLQLNNETPVIKIIKNKDIDLEAFNYSPLPEGNNLVFLALLSDYLFPTFLVTKLRTLLFNPATVRPRVIGTIADGTGNQYNPLGTISLLGLTEKIIKNINIANPPAAFASDRQAWKEIIQYVPLGELSSVLTANSAVFPYEIKNFGSTLKILKCTPEDITATEVKLTSSGSTAIIDGYNTFKASLGLVSVDLDVENFSITTANNVTNTIDFNAQVSLVPNL